MGEQEAVVLLSGGLDSATAAAMAVFRGHAVRILTVDYGQSHARELGSARQLARHFDALEHRIVNVNMGQWGGSALTDDSVEIPMDRKSHQMAGDIPSTYVPARNTIMLSLALGYAEVTNSDHIFIGVNALDYSGYPDCRPEFVEAYQRMADLATKRGVEGRTIRIEAPLIQMTKAEIVKRGMELGVPFEKTWSCYRGGKKACGRCDSCLLRLKGFTEAGFYDPLEYETGPHRSVDNAIGEKNDVDFDGDHHDHGEDI